MIPGPSMSPPPGWGAGRRALLFIDSLKAGGAERVTLQWADWLRQAGWNVVLLTSKGPDHDFYPCPDGLDRRLEPGADSRRRAGIGWPLRMIALHRLLRRGGFSLLIGVTTLPAIKLTLAAIGTGIPVVVAERNYPPARSLAPHWRLLRRLAYPRATLHLVQTERIALWLRGKGLARRTACLPNAVLWPQSRHAPVVDPQSCLPAEGRLVLAVGTKLQQKGFDRLVEAFALVAPRCPEWHLAILGLDRRPYRGDDQIAALEARLVDPSLRDRLHVPGKVGNTADWYGRADLFVLSSRYEGYPNVLLEAMAAGCACLACDCPTGPSELIESGRNGWLIPGEVGAAELASAMERLMGDPGQRARLASAAVAVRQDHAPALIQAQFASILAAL